MATLNQLLEKGVMIEPAALTYIQSNPSSISKINPTTLDTLTLEMLQKPPEATEFKDTGYRISYEYTEKFKAHKDGVENFLKLFNSRYEKEGKWLKNRNELRNLTSIVNLKRSKTREEASLIGLVSSSRETTNGHLMLQVEDPTGYINVLVPKNSLIRKKAEDIVSDEVIGIRGSTGREILFAREVIFPDVPQMNWPKGNSVAVFISDLHVGSKEFLEDVFQNFINWISGSDPLARRVKYLFIAGDIVDGVGIYKNQQKDLNIPDINKQYEKAARLLSQIPTRITVFVSPGNHDATRESEPQPTIPREFAHDLYTVPNIVMTSSPSYINVEGIEVLMYHGTSLDSMIATIPQLRASGYDQPQKAMIHQLKKRHLMPIYSEKTRTFPDREDHLVLFKPPNIFHSGHVHSLGIANYRGIRVINSSTFQARTAFQVKMGHHPEPGKVPYVDFANGTVGILDFMPKEEAI